MTHSYGGIPGTECSNGLSKTERKDAGKVGGVSRLIYVTSVVPEPGNSLTDLMGTLVPAFIKIEEVRTPSKVRVVSITDKSVETQGDFMSHVVEESAKLTFSDLAFEEAKEWVRKMPYHSSRSFDGKLTYPGYNHIPVSYIFCENDAILPGTFQRGVIESLERESGKKVDVQILKTGHCPNVSAPQELADAVARAIATTA